MAIGRFREGDLTAAEKEALRKGSGLSQEELQKRMEQRDKEHYITVKLIENTRKEQPKFKDMWQAQLYELCKKSIDPSDRAFCMICEADLEYEGNDKKCRVYCPDCGVDIEFTDLDKFKSETKIN